MATEKQQRIAEILTLFSEMFEKEISESYSRMYLETLERYPIEKIEAAAAHIIKTKTFNKFPLPAEFIQHIEPAHDIDVRTYRALEKVFDLMELHGAYRTVEFDDPLIHHTLIHLYGGWIEACDSRRHCRTDTDDRFWRRDFEKTYAAIARSNLQGEPPRLVGVFEKDNTDRGYVAAGLVSYDEPARLPGHKVAKQLSEGRETDQLSTDGMVEV